MRAAVSDLELTALPGAQSDDRDARLSLELKKIRTIALTAPVAIIVILEVARVGLIGRLDPVTRIVLDAIVVSAFAFYGAIIIRTTSAMRDRLKRQNGELLALHRAGLDLTADLSLETLLAKVVDQARNLIGAQYGALSVVGDDGQIRSFITSGISQEQRTAIGPPPIGHGVLGVVLREGQRLHLDDISRHPRSVGFPPNHPTMKTLLAVPVVCKSPFVGNLYLAEKDGTHTFAEDDEETLERFAVQAAIAIDNAYLHERVASLAIAQERLHIAHEIHDSVAQVLGYVNTKVQAAEEYLRREKTQEARDQLRELAAAAREAYGDTRESIVDLRTLPEAGRSFADVLREYVSRWKDQTGVSTHVSIDGGLPIAAASELQIIRIVQESLANVRKHSKATRVEIDLHRRDQNLLLTIVDDGLGFNPASRARSEFPQFGLSTMRERAESMGGNLVIDSAPGRGTSVRLEVPLART